MHIEHFLSISGVKLVASGERGEIFSFALLLYNILSSDNITGNMTSNSNLSNMRRLVEQLKLEASVERIKVSQAAAELQQFCLQNAGKDALLVGVPTGSNPFREPRSCAVV
ncbi:Guanine nucleotide-binding protein G(I)/G(S)/G(O) subunit gamma-10 [Xenotaenia resolanae]|uniref:Guanine nucleotide-binding protein subunit gamma n=1 Tax=Xenotaenia resolanae TaxID=208358 RepID=A0ABV0X0F8_9TELE